MSTLPATARPAGAERGARLPALLGLWRRHQGFVTGLVLGWILGRIAGALLGVELRALRPWFLLLSALGGGLAAAGAARFFAGLAGGVGAAAGRRRIRALLGLLAVLGVAAILLLAVYARFVVRVDYAGHTRSVAYVVSWSRSPACLCPPDDAQCIAALGFDLDSIGACWSGRGSIELALLLLYLSTLGGAGALVGLLLLPPSAPAAARPFLDFDLWIDGDPAAGAAYRAKAWSAAGFEATVRFLLPPALAAAEPFPDGFGAALRSGVSAVRSELGSGIDAAEPDTAGDPADPRAMGDELFRAIFQGELLKAFQGCLESARGGPGVRIRLRLNDAPALARLPWEYLHDAAGRGFLALSARTPVVRYLELSEALGTLVVEPPLRVLAVIATPRGYQELAAADEEWERLGEALHPLLASGRIVLERLASPTREALERRLTDGAAVHVLHFVGHGGWSDVRGEGVLIFESAEGEGVAVGGQSLAYLLQDHPTLRLAVLNACNGARASRDDVFAGTAQSLVHHGLPAVVAMQSEVRDATACRFAETFYRALAAGLPVDGCIGEARQALAAEDNLEWGTPVLYLRAADGRLFGVASEE